MEKCEMRVLVESLWYNHRDPARGYTNSSLGDV